MAKVALISMPWNDPFCPAIQLGTLKAYIESRYAGVTIDAFHFHRDIGIAVGLDIASHISMALPPLAAETVFAPQLFLEAQPWTDKVLEQIALVLQGVEKDQLRKSLYEILPAEVHRIAREIAWDKYLCVGFSIVYSQLFSSLWLASLIKASYPSTRIIFGGAICGGPAAPPLLRHFPVIDAIVTGEGEMPLAQIIERLRINREDPLSDLRSVATKVSHADQNLEPTQVSCLDGLPFPDYDGFFHSVNAEGVAADSPLGRASIPVESSRGCWWTVKGHNGNAGGCTFCSLNNNWKGYRDKGVDRFVAEVDYLTSKYRSLSLMIVDNVVRRNDTGRLFSELAGLGKTLQMHWEARATLKAEHFRLMRRAGVTHIQIGIEALGTRTLKRLNKGTTTIQNLESMKHCEEYSIVGLGNIIHYIPGVPEEEIREQIAVIEDYACCYRPLNYVNLTLSPGSPMSEKAAEYGIGNIRNADSLRLVMPKVLYEDLQLPFKDFDWNVESTKHAWQELLKTIQGWRRHYFTKRYKLGIPHILYFQEGGDFLRIYDFRRNDAVVWTIEGLEMAIHKFCSEIKTYKQIMASLSNQPQQDIDAALEKLLHRKLIFREGSKYLTLAVPMDVFQGQYSFRGDHFSSMQDMKPKVMPSRERTASIHVTRDEMKGKDR